MKCYSCQSQIKKGSFMFFFNLSAKSEGKMNLAKKFIWAKKQSFYLDIILPTKNSSHLAPGVEAGEVSESEGLPHQGVPHEGLRHHLGRPLAPHPPDRLPLPLIWRDWHPSTNTHMLPMKAKS